MAKKKKEIEEVFEVVSVDEETKTVTIAKPEKKEILMNEMVFRKGDEIELRGLPFKVHDIAGLDVTLRRLDIK